MSDARESSERLEEILKPAPKAYVPLEDELVEGHLQSVQLERLARMTDALKGRAGEEADEAGRAAVQDLLRTYTEAVAHLRAVASSAAARVDGAVQPLARARRLLRNGAKFQRTAYRRLKKR